jgi:putative hydrolase of the HAD superfamily
VPAVVFDLDETLIDRARSVALYASALWAGVKDQLDLEEQPFVHRFMALDGKGYVPRAEFFQRLSAELIPGLSPAQIEAHFYEHAWREPLLFAGATQGLRALKARGFGLGIVTNGRVRSQAAKIEHAGLAKLVDGYVISEAFGEKKPHPSIYQEICCQLGVTPQQAWFVGDHPVLDVWGSSQLGFRTIWVERNTPWPDDRSCCADVTVSSLAEAFETLLLPTLNEEGP